MDHRGVRPDDLLERGLDALRRGDGAAAREALVRLDLSAEVLEACSAAWFVLLEYPRAIDAMERAYALYHAGSSDDEARSPARPLWT